MAAEGSNGQPVTAEQVMLALNNANATNKRSMDALDKYGRTNELLLREINTVKHLQAAQPGLSEEAKKARLATGKPCSCVPSEVVCLFSLYEAHSLVVRYMRSLFLQYLALSFGNERERLKTPDRALRSYIYGIPCGHCSLLGHTCHDTRDMLAAIWLCKVLIVTGVAMF